MVGWRDTLGTSVATAARQRGWQQQARIQYKSVAHLLMDRLKRQASWWQLVLVHPLLGSLMFQRTVSMAFWVAACPFIVTAFCSGSEHGAHAQSIYFLDLNVNPMLLLAKSMNRTNLLIRYKQKICYIPWYLLWFDFLEALVCAIWNKKKISCSNYFFFTLVSIAVFIWIASQVPPENTSSCGAWSKRATYMHAT
jgi:hypothetical protein